MQLERRWVRALGAAMVAGALFGGCGGAEDQPAEDEGAELGEYALITAPAGFYFFPPLAPPPVYSGTFVATHLGSLSVELQKTDATGAWGPVVATFDATTTPRLLLKAEHERYVVVVRAADHFTDRAASYRYRVLDEGQVLATADVPAAIFSYVDRNREMRMSVQFRLEEGALDRDGDGVPNSADRCPDTYDPTNALPRPETCNGVDDDCNGTVDDGLGTTSCGVGACVTTVPACTGGRPTVCTPGLPTLERCNGVDDDCNGAIDDGLGTLSCGTGDCARTVPACVDGRDNTCVAGAPSAESCDGRDNDCNGSTDDGSAASSCAAVANGAPICVAGGCEVGACTPGWANCDGIYADGCEIDTTRDVNNCGVCGARCTTGQSCTTGVCTNPAPTLTTMAPATSPGVAFTLTVTGSSFVPSSVVRAGATDLATTYLSSTSLQASVPAAIAATNGLGGVSVYTPGPGGGTTETLYSATLNATGATYASTTPVGTSVGLALVNGVSGGTGASGAVNLTGTSGACTGAGISGTLPSCTIAGGTYNYTTFTVGTGVTLRVTGTTALVINATGAVRIDGTLTLDATGQTGGAGGYNGGNPSQGWSGFAGAGPGGGAGGSNTSGGSNIPGGGGGGHAGVGGSGTGNPRAAGGAAYNQSNVGGSGGGGGGVFSNGWGGGGGGAVAINATGNITIGGTITANGAAGNNGGGIVGAGGGGGGSGGRIALASAATITNTGTVRANGGNGGSGSCCGNGGGGSGGIITLTYTAFSGTIPAAPTGGSAGGAAGLVTTSVITYATSGTFTSAVVDTGGSSTFGALRYTTTASGQTVTLDARAGNTPTPDATWTAWTTNIANGGSLSALGTRRYIQYRANLSTVNTLATPLLDSVTASYRR